MTNTDGGVFWSGVDGAGRSVVVPREPRRIISLVPSQTEMLIDFGIADRLVGRTRYCIHPKDQVSKIEIVGGTKQVLFEKIQAIKPDLILAEKEENPEMLVNILSQLAPVYVTDVVSIPTAIAMIDQVGAVVGAQDRARVWSEKISNEFEVVKGICKPERVLYLIWQKPWMIAGRGTFISECLAHLGFVNLGDAITDADPARARYPEVTAEKILALNPDRVIFSSEPFPFREAHLVEFAKAVPGLPLSLANGELFSWYGTRMAQMPAYWKKWWAELTPTSGRSG